MALEVSDAAAQRLVIRDQGLLAPKMRDRVSRFQSECVNAGTPIRVWETCRTNELAKLYYALKKSKAPNAWHTWHFYHLAIDGIHPTKMWAWWERDRRAYATAAEYEEAKHWRETVVRIGKESGLDWGGDWTSFYDGPHFQFDTLKPSPSDRAIELYRTEGVYAVWSGVGAL